LRFTGRCYRGHDPTWSFSPLSGAGAAKTGGRFNRKGRPTLYLSLDVMTSIAECTQGLTQRLLPLTMCEYDVDCEPVANLRDGAGRDHHGITLAELGCAWLRHLRDGKDAPSWLVAERLEADGFVGMLAPSFVPNATAANCNLILWRWGPYLPTRVVVFDPTGRLPKDQLSWT
jgi:RES domain-containing protein